MSFPRLRFALLFSSSLATLAFACGGIADPTRGSERVATVSGALTGTSVPANARVALVWRTATSTPTDGGYAVGDDVPVVGGKFTMSLAVPPAGYFSTIDGRGFDSSSPDAPQTGNLPKPGPLPDPAPSGGGSSGSGKLPSFGARIAPRDTVSGGITSPLSGAVAGFVVYVDTNGNGKLDLAGTYAASSDEILGGNKELILAYLKDGGALDYEKLRDTSGILPAQGFNLAWIKGRWLPLNVVELKLDPKQGLPSPVCSSSGSSTNGSSSGGTGGFSPVAPTPPPVEEPAAPPGSSSSGGSSGSSGAWYPSPTDPNLRCAPDGRSFTYNSGATCPPPAPAPVGLCAGQYGDSTMGCASASYVGSLPAGGPIPAGWPCSLDGDQDAGPAGSSSGSSGSSGFIPDAGAGK